MAHSEHDQFLIEHGLLTAEEIQRLRRAYPDTDLLAAASIEGLLSSSVCVDLGHMLSEPPRHQPIPGILLLQEVGRGARGTVYRAWQIALRRLVAVKTLPREFLRTKEERGRFIREARIAARLEHPALVRAYDIGSADEFVYIVLEYAEGESLMERLNREGTLNADQTMQISMGIAEGLAFAAANGIAHRDIKPANIQLTPGGGVKILDLGLARPAGESELTQPLKVHGTPGYISPEQARGDASLTPAVDVYALGVLMFRCLTGRLPFEAADNAGMLLAHVEQTAPDVREHARGVPDALGDLVNAMLRKRPAKRPDAATVAAILRKILAMDGKGAAHRDNGRAGSERKPGVARGREASAVAPVVNGNNRARVPGWRVGAEIAGLVALVALGTALLVKVNDSSDEERIRVLEEHQQTMQQALDLAREREAVLRDAEAVREVSAMFPAPTPANVPRAITEDLEENKRILQGDAGED